MLRVEMDGVGLHFVAGVDEFGGEEFACTDPGEENMVAGPEGEGLKVGGGDPLQVAFFVLFQIACEFRGGEDEDVRMTHSSGDSAGSNLPPRPFHLPR